MRKDELLGILGQSESPMAPALIKAIKNYKKENHIYGLAIMHKAKTTLYTFNFLIWDNKEILKQVDECYAEVKDKENLFLKIN